MVLDLNIQDAHNNDVTALKACTEHPDLLISGAANGHIKIWEINDGTCLKTMKNYSGWVYKLIIFERPLGNVSASGGAIINSRTKTLANENNENFVPTRKSS
jgi:WD40 repeat protein